MVVNLEISEAEAAALEQALRSYLSNLHMEISQTDNAEFRKGLRLEASTLEVVVDKLKARQVQA